MFVYKKRVYATKKTSETICFLVLDELIYKNDEKNSSFTFCV